MSINFYISRDGEYEEGFEHTFEREAALRIAQQLWEKYLLSSGNNHYALIANPTTPPADLIIISTNGIGVLDLKNYSGKISGSDATAWYLLDDDNNEHKEVRGGSHLNPLAQVKTYTQTIFRKLKQEARQNPKAMPSWMRDEDVRFYSQAAVVFTAGTVDLTQLNLDSSATEPWFKIRAPHEISSWAYSLKFGSHRYKNLTLNPNQIDYIARQCFEVEEWTEIEDFLSGGEPYGYLWVIQNDERMWQYMLTNDEVTIGRSPTNDVHIASELFEQVSRQHALLRRIGNEVHVFDQGSRHGTWVNGIRVTENDSTILKSGDQLTLGAMSNGKPHPTACQFLFKSASRSIDKTISIDTFSLTDNSGTVSIEQLESVLSQSYAQEYKKSQGIFPGQFVRVNIDPSKGKMATYIGYLIVEQVQNPQQEIELSQALKINPIAKIGDIQLIPSDWIPDSDQIQSVIEDASRSISLADIDSAADGGAFVSSMLGGQLLDGKYYLHSDDFKSGGFGHVYRASQRNMGNRTVAVKVLKRGRVADELYEEAQKSATIEHRNIVRLYDINTTEDGTTYLVMEWVDGLTLLQWRRENLAYEADFVSLLKIAYEICEGLASIHDAGIVHGDISPKNVLLTQSKVAWVPKLADFGLAWALSEGKPERRGGTPLYIAPEIFDGRPDHRSDVYSLGAVLFYLFTGTHHLGDLNVLKQQPLDLLKDRILSKAPLRISDIQNGIFNPELDDLIYRMVSKDQNERPQNIHDVLEKLSKIINYSPAIEVDIVQAPLSFYIPVFAIKNILRKLEEQNTTWLQNKIAEIPDWYFDDTQQTVDIFQAIFGSNTTYDVFIFNNGRGRNDQLELKICLASYTYNPANLRLLQAIEKVPIFYAEINPDRRNIFISGMSLIPLSDAIYSHTNSLLAQIEFTTDSGSYPIGLWERIASLPRETLPDPDTQEKLKHWQGYLDVWEKLALEKEYEVEYIEWRYDSANEGVWFTLYAESEIPWEKIKRSRDNYIVLAEMKDSDTIQDEIYKHRDSEDEYDPYNRVQIGEIKKVEPNRQRVLVALDDSFLQKRWDRESQLPEIPSVGKLDYTARGDRSNIKQQRSALDDLIIGKTANPRLNRFIFDAQEAAIPDTEIIPIDNRDLLSKNLNPDQKKAVEYALAAPDLYLIQGPPGTGKTTVIAELCYQFTKQGKRVLLASQANLAVDNALSRLTHSPNILALRMGNLNSIENEGAVFVESNVVKRWFTETLRDQNDIDQNFATQAENFSFIAINRTGVTRLIDKLITIEPVLQNLHEHSLSFQDRIADISNNISRHQDELALLNKLIELVKDTRENWQHGRASHNLFWRNQNIDLLQLEPFLLYLEAILHAENILRDEKSASIADIERQLLSVLERDMLKQLRSGNDQAHLQIENPLSFFKLGYSLSRNLQELEGNDIGWYKLLDQITQVQELDAHFRLVNSLGDMQARIDDTNTLISITRKLQVLFDDLHETEQEEEQLKKETSLHKSEITILEAHKTENQGRLLKLTNAHSQIPQLIEVIDEIQSQWQITQNRITDLQHSDELRELENVVSFGESLIDSCRQIISQPMQYMLFDGSDAIVNSELVHEHIAKLYANHVISVNDTSLKLFEHVAEAMRQKLQEMQRKVGTTRGNKNTVKEIKEDWWVNIIKPHFSPKDRNHVKGDQYVFENPNQAWEKIRSELQTIRLDADHRDALFAMQKFFEDEAPKRREYLVGAKLKSQLETQLPKWLETHTINLRKLQKLKEDTETRLLALKDQLESFKISYQQEIQRIVVMLSEPDVISDGWLKNISKISGWTTSKEQLNRYLNDLNATANNLSNAIEQIESDILKYRNKLTLLMGKIQIIQNKVASLIEVRNTLRVEATPQLEAFYKNYKQHSVSLNLFDAVSTLFSIFSSTTTIDAMNSSVQNIMLVESEFRDVVQDYRELLGSLSYEDYIKLQTNQRANLLNELWTNLHPLQASANLELETHQLKSWKEYLEQIIHNHERLQEIIDYLNPELILSKWENILGENKINTSGHIGELETQYANLETELQKNNSEIANLEQELKDWTTLWHESLHNVPEHLRDLIPDRSDFASEPDFITEVDSIAQNHKWQKHYDDMVKQSEAIDELVADWKHRLENVQPMDERSILILYMNNANVIGTSCGQVRRIDRNGAVSANFDVAIIDEVSKATPPELLMPMIRANKIVLLGDHKQLPPMIGSDNTMREIAEELNLPEEHLAHLQEPLFKHLFNSAPSQLKIMLREQYRMRPVIRDAITIFYDRELKGGHDRKHGFEIPNLFGSETAFAWFDLPRHDSFAEENVGTSYRNMAEIATIRNLLFRMNQNWQAKLDSGVVSKPKDIGLITFYMPQYSELLKMIKENDYPALNMRVGTVDRFQGMERPVIIVSTVRNNSYGAIGFAKAPERINVAFSRAQELLVVVGCQTIFTNARGNDSNTENARLNYQHIANLINQNTGGKLIRVPEDFKIN